MLTLYQAEWCGACHRVRQVMTELGLTYTAVNVSADRDERAEVIAVSNQPGIPTLQDGDKILASSDDIIEYLRETYPAPPDAEQHAAQGAWRAAGLVSLAPQAAAARVKELLEDKGFKIIVQITGDAISDRLPEDYILLQVAMPVAAVKVLKFDPLAPAAILLPIAIVPTGDGGSAVATADPVAQVWLFGEPPLTRIQTAVKERLADVLNAL
jgi:glutaredoxin